MEITNEQYDCAYLYLMEQLKGCFGKKLGEDHMKIQPRFAAEITDAYESVMYSQGRKRFFLLERGSGQLYMFNGRYYDKYAYTLEVFEQLIKDTMRGLGIGVVYQKNIYKSVARQCMSGMKSRGIFFVPDRRYAVFTNCVLNLEDGSLHGFDMKYHTDLVFDFPYKGGYADPLWNRLLVETIPDLEMRTAFQMFCGAFLVDRSKYSIEYMCYLIGEGRNGKSLLSGAVANTLGERLTSNFSPSELFVDGDRKRNLAELEGKVANFSDDIPVKDFSGGNLKQFVSGHKMSARKMYGDPFDLGALPLFLCCVNELPRSQDRSLGHYRRMLPILCPNVVPLERMDTQLPFKLATDTAKCGIFNWMYEGYQRLIGANGVITVGVSISEAVEDIMEDDSVVARWARDRGIVPVGSPSPSDPRYHVLGEWVTDLKVWCRDNGEKCPDSRTVGKEFSRMGFSRMRRSNGTYWCMDVGVYAPLKQLSERRARERLERQNGLERTDSAEVLLRKKEEQPKLPF